VIDKALVIRIEEQAKEIEQLKAQNELFRALTGEPEPEYLTVTVSTLGDSADKKEIGRLKAQNKLMWEALMCLPGAMSGTVHGVCRICLRNECEECVIDKAIREGMSG
jgi:hypothetical protein